MSNWRMYDQVIFPPETEGKHCLSGGISLDPHKNLHSHNDSKFKGVHKTIIMFLECYGKSEFEKKGYKIQRISANMCFLSPKHCRIIQCIL